METGQEKLLLKLLNSKAGAKNFKSMEKEVGRAPTPRFWLAAAKRRSRRDHWAISMFTHSLFCTKMQNVAEVGQEQKLLKLLNSKTGAKNFTSAEKSEERATSPRLMLAAARN